MGAVVGAVALAGSSIPAMAGPNSGKVTFSVGNDITTAYFFRGILQERNGFIDQPYGEVNFNLYSAEDETLTGITLIGGVWNSIQTEQTLADGDGGPANWYEADIYGGLKFTLLGKLDLKALYIAYTYPNGAFATVQEIDLSAGLNDSEWLGAWAMYPTVTFARELDNTALGNDEGSYVQFDLKPGFTLIESETYPVTVSFPLTVGISAGDYYEIGGETDETFGFAKGGVTFSVPLAFIPEDYGAWSASAGAAIYGLGSNLKQINEDDSPWVVGTWSINWTY
jgi:hypothetical protein